MQVRFRGVLASDDRSDPLLVTELDLGGMSVRSADSDNLNAHGTTSGRDFVTDNSVKFVLWSNRKNYQQGVRELNRFLDVWRKAIYESKTGQLMPLEYRHDNDGPWQTIFGSPDHSDNSQIDEIAHHGFSQASFEFRQHLPLTYGPERTVDVTDVGYVNFTLSNGPVKPVVTFHGPFTDPSLTLGNMRIGLRGSAPANDYWIVDPYARTIKDRYGRNSPARADRLTVLSRIEAEPLNHTATLTSAPSAKISWRPSAYNKYEGGTMIEYRWTGEPGESPAIRLEDGVPTAWNPLASSDQNVYRFWRQDSHPPAGSHYEWLGEPHESESVKLVDGVEVARNLYPDPSFRSGSLVRNTMMPGAASRALSSEWSSSGGQSLKHVSTYDRSGSAYLDIYRSSWADDGMYDWLPDDIRGKWLGVSITLHKPDDDSDQEYPLGRLWFFSPSTSHDSQFGAGTERLKIAFPIPLTEDYFPRLYHYGPRDSPPIYWDDLSLSVADTEAEALAQVEHYFDGSTASDRANDLWYDAEGVPHVWVNGQGWVVLDDNRLGPVPENFETLPIAYGFDGDTLDYILREDS